MALRERLLPWLSQPQEAVRLREYVDAPGALAFLASASPFPRTAGAALGVGGAGVYSACAASSDYVNAGRVARLSPGAFTLLAVVEPVSTAIGTLSGVVDTGTTYNEVLRINADGLGSAASGKVSAYVRSTSGVDRAVNTSASVLDVGRVSVVALQVVSGSVFRLFVDGVDCAVTYQVTNTVGSSSGVTDYSLDIGNRNSRGVHGDGSAHRIYAYARIPSNAIDLARATASPADFFDTLFEPQRIFVPVVAAVGAASVAASQALESPSNTAAATVSVAAAAAQSLPSAGQSAAAAVIASSSSSQAVSACTQSATAAAVGLAAAAQVVPAVTQSAAATVGDTRSAAAAQQVPAASMSATAAAVIAAGSIQVLPAPSVAALAQAVAAAQAAQLLAGVTQAAIAGGSQPPATPTASPAGRRLSEGARGDNISAGQRMARQSEGVRSRRSASGIRS